MKKYFLFLILFLIFIFNCPKMVYATKLDEKFTEYYFYRRGGGKAPESGELHTYSIDGVTTYCIEPGVLISEDADYVESSEAPYDTEIMQVIELYAYYGYGYEGHDTLRYQMATQMLIWDKLSGQQNEVWTEVGGEGNYIDLSKEKNEILRLIEIHHTRPSFNYDTKTALLNEEVFFEDENHVIDDYEICNGDGTTAYIKDNRLYIRPYTGGIRTITYERKGNKNPNRFFYSTNNQKQAYFSSFSPVYGGARVKVINGTVEVYKTDNYSERLANVTFGVYNDKNQEVCQIVTNDEGYGKCEGLNYGNYKIKELNVKDGYHKDDKLYEFTLTEENETKSFNFINNKIMGYIELQKKSDNQSISLKGAIYEILDSENKVVGRLITDDKGYAKSELLPFGEYTVKEKEAPKGYLIDSNTYHVTIKDDMEIIKINSMEKVIKGYIELYKVDADTGNTPQGDASLKGAIYEILDSENKVVGRLTTDDKGYAKSELLPFGEYTIKEKEAPKGYLIDSNNYHVTIKNDMEIIKINSMEKVIKGYIELYKVDADTGNTPQGDASLKGAIYEILDSENKVVDRLITDDKGYAKSNLLPFGNYYIKETEASLGYKLDKKKYSVKIENNQEIVTINSKEEIRSYDFNLFKTKTNGKLGIVEAEMGAEFYIYLKSNHQLIDTLVTDNEGKASIHLPYGTYQVCQIKGSNYNIDTPCFDINIKTRKVDKVINDDEVKAKIKIIKIDEDTKKAIPLKGIKFKIKDLDTNTYICQNVTYPNAETVCEFATNKDGYLYTPYYLYGGNYELEEIDQKINGYLWNKNKIKFTIDKNTEFIKDSKLGNILEIKFTNKEVKGEIIINKVGEQLVLKDNSFNYENVSLNDVAFSLYAAKNIYSGDGTLIFKKDTLIGTYNTINGTIKISDLYLGDYYVIEKKTLDNYVLDKEKYYITLAYKDQYTMTVSETLNLKNYLQKGKLTFTKKDDNNELLANAKIAIYYYTYNEEKATLIYEGLTNESGNITLDNLFIGKYYLIETMAPEGYSLNNTKLYFEIKDNNTEVNLEMVDKKVLTEELIYDVPDTYSNLDNIINIIVIVLSILSYLIVYEKKNN